MKQRILFFCKMAFGVGLFALILSRIPLLESAQLVSDISPLPLAAALVCVFTANALLVLRWKVVLAACGFTFPFLRLAAVNFVGIFFSNFLPGSVGGDIVKVFYIVAPRKSGHVLSATILSRIAGMLAVFLLGLAAMALVSPVFRTQPWWTTVGMALVGAALALVAVLTPSIDRLIPGLLKAARFPEKWVALAEDLLVPIQMWRRQRAPVAFTMVLAIAYQVIGPMLILYFCARALGITFALGDVAMISAIANVAFALPISVNGLGVAEGVYIYLFVMLEVSPERALLLALLYRVVCTTQALVGGVVYFFLKQTHSFDPQPAN